MKKHFLFLLFMITVSLTVQAQTRGVKIGYIDMEYILQNVPDYTEAKNQLEQKAQKWKQEAEIKQMDITKLKEALKTERVLLTKELIEEREEEIAFQEKGLLDYQEKRFGPTGDLMVQKAVLAQPVQDQVFTAVQDIAEAKKYDFVFNKTSDLTMLFSAKRYDISDQVIRIINRSSKRNQSLSKKEQKAQEAKEALEDMEDANPGIAERQKKIDEKRAAREKLVADRKAAQEAKRQAALDKRKGGKDAKPATTTAEGDSTAKPAGESPKTKTASDAPTTETPEEKVVDSAAVKRQKTAEERAKIIADRKKAQEEKRAKALADREAAKKAKQEKAKDGKKED